MQPASCSLVTPDLLSRIIKQVELLNLNNYFDLWIDKYLLYWIAKVVLMFLTMNCNLFENKKSLQDKD